MFGAAVLYESKSGAVLGIPWIGRCKSRGSGARNAMIISLESLNQVRVMTTTFKRIPRFHRVLGLCALAFSSAASAQFSWQVAGSYRDDSSNVLDSNQTALSATYYFSQIDEQDSPLELAPFLNRSSYVTIEGAWGERSGSYHYAPDGLLSPETDEIEIDLGADTSEYAVSGRYVWPDAGWYVGGRIERGHIDRRGDRLLLETDTDSEGFDLRVGKYLGYGTALELRIGSAVRTRIEELNFPRLNAEIDFGTETETDHAELSVRHAGILDNRIYWLAANVGRVRSDTRRIAPAAFQPDSGLERSTSGSRYGFAAGLYPSRTFGVRLFYSRTDGDSSLTGVSASWFFVPNAAVELGIARTKFDFEQFPLDMDSVTLRLLARF